MSCNTISHMLVIVGITGLGKKTRTYDWHMIEHSCDHGDRMLQYWNLVILLNIAI